MKEHTGFGYAGDGKYACLDCKKVLATPGLIGTNPADPTNTNIPSITSLKDQYQAHKAECPGRP